MSSFFKGPPTAKEPVKPTMPDEDDPAVIAARTQPYLDAQTASGRMSTILTGETKKLGAMR